MWYLIDNKSIRKYIHNQGSMIGKEGANNRKEKKE